MQINYSPIYFGMREIYKYNSKKTDDKKEDIPIIKGMDKNVNGYPAILYYAEKKLKEAKEKLTKTGDKKEDIPTTKGMDKSTNGYPAILYYAEEKLKEAKEKLTVLQQKEIFDIITTLINENPTHKSATFIRISYNDIKEKYHSLYQIFPVNANIRPAKDAYASAIGKTIRGN